MALRFSDSLGYGGTRTLYRVHPYWVPMNSKLSLLVKDAKIVVGKVTTTKLSSLVRSFTKSHSSSQFIIHD